MSVRPAPDPAATRAAAANAIVAHRRAARRRIAAMVATTLLLLGACGQRGPLYLPDPAKEAQKRQTR